MDNKLNRRNRYTETGDMLVNKLKKDNHHLVLDLGCGENLYKDIPNVVGIDIEGTNCDILGDIDYLPFDTGSVPCILALGVFIHEDNNLNSSLLDKQLIEVSRVMCISGVLYGRSPNTKIWNIDTIPTIGSYYGYNTINNKYIVSNSDGKQRIYWEWKKLY